MVRPVTIRAASADSAAWRAFSRHFQWRFASGCECSEHSRRGMCDEGRLLLARAAEETDAARAPVVG